MTWNMNEIVGTHDIVFLTLDTLRYDVAEVEMRAGRTPEFQALFPDGWEGRYTPGNFTYSAHHAFFSGFLPTPSDPKLCPERLFAARFAGSETSGPNTCQFDSATIIEGLAQRGYHTLCIGGVGFFNRKTALSRVFPEMFAESHWSDALSVVDPESTRNQFTLAAERLEALPQGQRLFLFINVSAIHQPNCHYLPGQKEDDLSSHAAALRYVDSQLPLLLAPLRKRADTFLIICSDHGTLYGENGFTGHRVGHEHVYTVPYAETRLPLQT